MIQTQRLSAFAAFATLALTGVNNDWSSRCDRITNPAQAETGDARGAPPPLAAWNLMAHNLFVNLYYDFASDSRMTPYVGLGAGGARTTLDYFSRWKRNDDPDLITTFEDPLLRARLAGTTSIGKASWKTAATSGCSSAATNRMSGAALAFCRTCPPTRCRPSAWASA